MPKYIADDLLGHAGAKQACGARMPEGMGPSLAQRCYTGRVEPLAYGRIETGAADQAPIRWHIRMKISRASVLGRPQRK